MWRRAFPIGYAYTALKRVDEGASNMSVPLSIDEKMPEDHMNLGILLLNRQQYDRPGHTVTKAGGMLPAAKQPRSPDAVEKGKHKEIKKMSVTS